MLILGEEMFYSPLRYPGGKGKLEPLMEVLIRKTNHVGGTYVEPFAGGAGIALALLENNIVNKIVINDLDKRIYSFWKAILIETKRFLDDIQNVTLSIDEWKRQCFIVQNAKKYSYELGFATFYLNRTNRSGIIKGGVIGGIEQRGKWKMDARFNRDNLSERILNIVKKKKNIHIYNKDVLSFIDNYLPKYGNNTFAYFDPPYYEKGKQLYLNSFLYEDHVRIKEHIHELNGCDWVITYDDVPEIAAIYDGYNIMRYDLNYSVSKKKKASEIIIFKNGDMIPNSTELKDSGYSHILR